MVESSCASEPLALSFMCILTIGKSKERISKYSTRALVWGMVKNFSVYWAPATVPAACRLISVNTSTRLLGRGPSAEQSLCSMTLDKQTSSRSHLLNSGLWGRRTRAAPKQRASSGFGRRHCPGWPSFQTTTLNWQSSWTAFQTTSSDDLAGWESLTKGQPSPPSLAKPALVHSR